MRARIADYLDRDDLGPQIDTAINRAIRFYRSKRFTFNEVKDATFETVANQISYTTTDGVPSDILQIDTAVAVIGSLNYPLIARPYQYIVDMNLGNFANVPDFYAWYDNSIWLYPVPASAYEVQLSYLKSYADLVVNDDTNDFLTEAEDLIEQNVLWRIYTSLIRDTDEAQTAKAAEQLFLEELQEEVELLKGTGFITYHEM